MKKTLFTILASALTVLATAKEKKADNILGDNLVSFAPISIIDKGMGIGLSYERMIDAEQKIAFVLPVDFVMWNPETQSNTANDNKLFYTYLSPGITFYPAGLRKVNYGIGPNLMLAYGKGSEWIYSGAHNGQIKSEYTNFRMGLMINQYLLMNITSNVSLQLNVGMGLRYINNYDADLNLPAESFGPQGINLMGQFKFQIGYRF